MERLEIQGGQEAEFEDGKLVRIKLNSGDVEEGWVVKGRIGNRIKLEKDGFRKLPKIEDLRSWNS